MNNFFRKFLGHPNSPIAPSALLILVLSEQEYGLLTANETGCTQALSEEEKLRKVTAEA